jgi:F-type H+-transporting ATPase subunit c
MENEVFMSAKEISMALAIWLWAFWPWIGLGMIGKGALEALWRNPEASDKIKGLAMLALGMTEAVAIYALVTALVIWFAL